MITDSPATEAAKVKVISTAESPEEFRARLEKEHEARHNASMQKAADAARAIGEALEALAKQAGPATQE